MTSIKNILYIQNINRLKVRSFENDEVPLWRSRRNLISMKIRVWSLALLSGLKTQRCCELWCRSQMQLGSGIAMAMAVSGNCSSDSIPCLVTFKCHGCGHKKKKKKDWKWKDEGKINHANRNEKRVWVTVSTLDKTDIKANLSWRYNNDK